MLKRIRLQSQIVFFAILLSTALLLLSIFPIYYTFKKVVFNQVTENSRMMLEQMNLLDSQIFSRLENLALSITMDAEILEGLYELKKHKGTDQIDSVNKITDQLIFYMGVWDEISKVSVFTDAMELESYLIDWNYNYVRSMESDEYRNIADKIAGRNQGILLMTGENQSDREQYILFYRKVDVFSDKENEDILCIKLSETIFKELFDQKYSKDSSYYMIDLAGNVVAGNREHDIFSKLQEEPQFLNELSQEGGFELKNINRCRYIVSYSRFNRFGIRMLEFRPYASLMENMKDLLLKMIFAGMAILCVAVLLIIRFANYFVRPILYLCGQMERVGTGNFDVNVEDEYTNEIGQMNKHFLSMVKKIKALIQNIEQVSQQKNIAEFEVLQQQINPHFLYNVLDSINWMAIRANQKNISQAVVQLGGFFRLSLSKGKSIITFCEELERLQNYIALQKLCTNKQINYVEDIEEDLYKVKIIRLILQPFVENAIIHGQPHEDEDYEISVSGWCEGKDFYIQISDEGVGISTERMEDYLTNGVSNDGGYGIYNVNQRIKLYYGEEYGIRYLPVKKGTTVLLHLSRDLEDDNVSNDDCR